MSSDLTPIELSMAAGIASTDLIADPAQWINRRVETVELLSHEETRRRVSIDFTLSDDRLGELLTGEGVVVPISVLSKEPRRNFDLRDESDTAVPVLGKEINGEIAHAALMSAAIDVLPDDLSQEAFQLIWSDLRQVVLSSPEDAAEALGVFVGSAESGDSLRSAVWQSATCRSLLDVLHGNYVLFAVLPAGGPNRRILKYSYGDDFSLDTSGPFWERLTPWWIVQRLWWPDRSRFAIACPACWRAASFHAEIAIPEELRVEMACLYDFVDDEPISEPDREKNRACLYATQAPGAGSDVFAYAQVATERRGKTFQAGATSVVISALLWLGVSSGLDARSPGAAVSLLLAGAALFSGVAAARGEHLLVTKLFSAARRWLGVVSLAALVASATLAMQIPSAHPTEVWRISAIVCTAAAARLVWSAIRAAS